MQQTYFLLVKYLFSCHKQFMFFNTRKFFIQSLFCNIFIYFILFFKCYKFLFTLNFCCFCAIKQLYVIYLVFRLNSIKTATLDDSFVSRYEKFINFIYFRKICIWVIQSIRNRSKKCLYILLFYFCEKKNRLRKEMRKKAEFHWF